MAEDRCPYCNKDLTGYSSELVLKHIASCHLKINPYIYSNRRRGRPSKKEREEIQRERDIK